MVSPRREVIPRSRKVLGCSGLILALGGLAFFWLPLVGVLLWALGLGISAVSLFVRGARAYGFSGVAVSLLCLGFTYVFLVMPWTPSEEKSSDAAARAAGTGAGVAAHNSNSQKTLADIFSSFGYRKKRTRRRASRRKTSPQTNRRRTFPTRRKLKTRKIFRTKRKTLRRKAKRRISARRRCLRKLMPACPSRISRASRKPARLGREAFA